MNDLSCGLSNKQSPYYERRTMSSETCSNSCEILNKLASSNLNILRTLLKTDINSSPLTTSHSSLHLITFPSRSRLKIVSVSSSLHTKRVASYQIPITLAPLTVADRNTTLLHCITLLYRITRFRDSTLVFPWHPASIFRRYILIRLASYVWLVIEHWLVV